MPTADPPIRPAIPVWDPLVRICHWSLVTSVVLAWFTRHAGGAWHEVLGYIALAVVGVRLVWGFMGSAHARFVSFVTGPRATLAYGAQVLRGTEPRYVGHNPLGAWMIVALVTVVILVCASGWLYTTDRYWGIEWVETLHRQLTNVLILLVAFHVLGVLLASHRHRENLVASMIHGRKRRMD